MALKPEVSIPVALATASVVYASFSQLPSVPDMRSAEPMDPDLQGGIKAAAWISAAAVGGISLIAKDATIFIVGGFMTVALYWWRAHADAHDPLTQQIVSFTSERQQMHPDDMEADENAA